MSTLRYSGQTVTLVRRFLGDNWLEALLQILTLYLGWLIWFAIAAKSGQTPAKQLVNVYIHNYDSGSIASAGRTWMREVVGKYGLPWFISITAFLQTGSPVALFAGNIFFLIGGVTILFNEEKRALWDFVAGTVVRYHPQGAPLMSDSGPTLATSRAAQRLQQLTALRSRGLISEDEYEAKRNEILASI